MNVLLFKNWYDNNRDSLKLLSDEEIVAAIVTCWKMFGSVRTSCVVTTKGIKCSGKLAVGKSFCGNHGPGGECAMKCEARDCGRLPWYIPATGELQKRCLTHEMENDLSKLYGLGPAYKYMVYALLGNAAFLERWPIAPAVVTPTATSAAASSSSSQQPVVVIYAPLLCKTGCGRYASGSATRQVHLYCAYCHNMLSQKNAKK